MASRNVVGFGRGVPSHIAERGRSITRVSNELACEDSFGR